jgi:hypothetical protein
MTTATRLASALAVCLMAGCADATGPVDFTGRYTLRTIDGRGLPAVVAEDAEWQEVVLSGSITLVADGSCSVSRAWRVIHLPTGQAVGHSFTVPCDYTISNGTLSMTFAEVPDEQEPAAISDGLITVLVAGAAWVFQR